MEGDIVDIELINIITHYYKMLYGRRDSRYHYNNIIIRCCMEGDIVDIELITIIILL